MFRLNKISLVLSLLVLTGCSSEGKFTFSDKEKTSFCYPKSHLGESDLFISLMPTGSWEKKEDESLWLTCYHSEKCQLPKDVFSFILSKQSEKEIKYEKEMDSDFFQRMEKEGVLVLNEEPFYMFRDGDKYSEENKGYFLFKDKKLVAKCHVEQVHIDENWNRTRNPSFWLGCDMFINYNNEILVNISSPAPINLEKTYATQIKERFQETEKSMKSYLEGIKCKENN